MNLSGDRQNDSFYLLSVTKEKIYMIRLLHFCLFLCFAYTIQAQQIPLFTQYRQHASILNPAMVNSDYLAFENNISIGVSYRSQWLDIKNHPVTQTLIGDYLYTEGSGVNLMAGGYLINDQTGPTGFTGAYIKGGGMLTDDPYFGGLSFGLSLGVVQYRVNVQDIRLRDISDTLPLDNQSKVFPDAGLGAFYYQRLSTKNWMDESLIYGGISIPQVIGLNLEFSDLTGSFDTKRIQHFYAVTGFYKFFDNDSFLEPSAWVRFAPNAPISVDFNIRYQLNAGFWVGTGASTGGNAHLETGFIIAERLRIGYGFDYSFSTFGGLAGNTHEIHLNYSFPY